MITSMRRYMQTATYRYLLFGAVIFLIIALLAPPLIRQQGGGEWVMEVNGSKISDLTFRRKVIEQQEMLNQIRRVYGAYADWLLQSMGLSSDPKQLAHQQLVREELLNEVARKLHIYPHATSIARELNDMRFIQQNASLIPPYVVSENGAINEQYLRQHLQRMRLTAGDFDQLLSQAVSRQMVESLIGAATYIPLTDIRQRFIDENLAKKFSIVSFSLDTFLNKEKNTKISDQELQEFFDRENAQFKRYLVAEKRGGSQWKFTPATYGITVDDAEIMTYYEDNKTNDYVDKPTQVQVRRIVLAVNQNEDASSAQEQAIQLQRELVSGTRDFAQTAKELSADKNTADKGGLMPFFGRGEKEHAFERAAFVLKEVGDISSVIQTPEGFEIVQLVEKRLRTFTPLASVKNDIKQKLMLKKFKTQFVQDMKELLEKPTQKNLETFIKVKGGKQEAVKPAIQDQSALMKALFAIEKKDSLNFYVDKEIGYAVQLSTIEEPFLPTLQSIKDVVTNDIYENRATKAMHLALEQAKKDAIDQPDLVFNNKNQSREETGWIKKDAVERIKSLEKRGISVERILQLEKIGSVSLHVGERDGYLVRLDAIESFDEALFLTQKENIENKLYSEQARLILEGFVASLYRNATISVNESIMNLY
jgi:peptidyl-prolyl cis-trans isomerase D